MGKIAITPGKYEDLSSDLYRDQDKKITWGLLASQFGWIGELPYLKNKMTTEGQERQLIGEALTTLPEDHSLVPRANMTTNNHS